MKKDVRAATIGLVIGLIIICIAACGGTTAKHQTTTNFNARPHNWSKVLDANYSRAMILCKNYYGLVNLNWDDNHIFLQLKDAGAFDRYGSQARPMYHAMIKWCYKHD